MDQQTRGAKVTVADKKGRAKELNRPLKLLYPLEVQADGSSRDQATTTRSDDQPQSVD